MSQRLLSVIVVILALLGGGYFLKSSRPPSTPPLETESTGTPRSFPPITSPQEGAPSTDKVVAEEDSKGNGKTFAKDQDLQKVLSDSTVSPQEKIRQISALQPKELNAGDVQNLFDFVISENPYAHLKTAYDPHHQDALKLRNEAAVRVFALRVLAENLSLEQFQPLALQVKSRAPDVALRNIAEQALEAKAHGENYFENAKKAIQNLPLPEK